MKYIKLYEDFKKIQKLTVYHLSLEKLNKLIPNKSLWCDPDLKTSICRYKLNNEGYNYKFNIEGIFLTETELFKIGKQLKLDIQSYIYDLLTNPENPYNLKETLALVALKNIDGFYHNDYDGCNDQKNKDTLFLINPIQSIKKIVLLNPNGKQLK